MTKRFAFAFAVICTFFMFSSCVHNMDTMIADYNGCFAIETPVNGYTVDDIPAELMLKDSYVVSYLSSLCLTAPSGGIAYSWIAEVYENSANEEEGTLYNLGGNQELVVYMRTSDIKRWGTYKLTLTVTKSSGEMVKDTAWLHVY